MCNESAVPAGSNPVSNNETLSNLSRFSAYAEAFEEAYRTDDWAVVDPFFGVAAVFTTGIADGRITGCQAILDYF